MLKSLAFLLVFTLFSQTFAGPLDFFNSIKRKNLAVNHSFKSGDYLPDQPANWGVTLTFTQPVNKKNIGERITLSRDNVILKEGEGYKVSDNFDSLIL